MGSRMTGTQERNNLTKRCAKILDDPEEDRSEGSGLPGREEEDRKKEQSKVHLDIKARGNTLGGQGQSPRGHQRDGDAQGVAH